MIDQIFYQLIRLAIDGAAKNLCLMMVMMMMVLMMMNMMMIYITTRNRMAISMHWIDPNQESDRGGKGGVWGLGSLSPGGIFRSTDSHPISQMDSHLVDHFICTP